MCALFAMNVTVDASKVDLIQHIKIGQEDTITFGVRGYPKPQITWKKGRRTLNPANDARYKLLNDGSLTIVNVKVSDQDNYTVTVKQGGYGVTKQIEVYAVGRYCLISLSCSIFVYTLKRFQLIFPLLHLKDHLI